MAKNNRKRHWRSNQSQETYFIESKKQKFRSRSTFKLIEINKKFKIFQPYSSILDLGASPGGWSEYSVRKLNNKVKVIATDLISMERINKVEFILGDFLNEDTQRTILKENSMKKFDVIISDISPSKTGNKVTDQFHFYNISNEILEFSKKGLKSN